MNESIKGFTGKAAQLSLPLLTTTAGLPFVVSTWVSHVKILED